MHNGWYTAGLLSILLSTARFSVPEKIFCSCDDLPSVEDAFQITPLVVQGRIVGMDTVTLVSSIVHDKNGIKTGRHKYSTRSEELVRVKFVVETNFKSPGALPDTIFIVTSPESTACGYHFPQYFDSEYINLGLYNYIIYPRQWTDYTLNTYLYRKKTRGIIKETVSSNTFATSQCMRTRPANTEELQKLHQLKR